MRKRELEKKIRESFEADTPNVIKKIEKRCEEEAQYPRVRDQEGAVITCRPVRRAWGRAVAFAACMALLVTGISLGVILPRIRNDVSDVVSIVYIDVNPSIKISLDGEDRVIKCEAANEDAEKILSGIELEGEDMDTALSVIMDSMCESGYLTDDANSILVSVSSDDEEKHELVSSIPEKINRIFEDKERKCSIIAQRVEVNGELEARAKENGVSVGKMHLVDKMIGEAEDLVDGDAATLTDMSITELNLMYSTIPSDKHGKGEFEKDITVGDVGGFADRDEALETLLEEIGKQLSEVESYTVRARFGGDGEKKMVYVVSLKFAGDENEYKFEVDCVTCEVKEIASADEKHPDGEEKPEEKSEEKSEEKPEEKPEEIPEERPHPDGGFATLTDGEESVSEEASDGDDATDKKEPPKEGMPDGNADGKEPPKEDEVEQPPLEHGGEHAEEQLPLQE